MTPPLDYAKLREFAAEPNTILLDRGVPLLKADLLALLAENERMAAALRLIGLQRPEPSNSPDKTHENYLRRVLIDIARQALPTPSTDGEG